MRLFSFDLPLAILRIFGIHRFNRADFMPNTPIDPKTMVLPMISDQQGKSFYDVANDWAGERIRAKRLILRAIEGTYPRIEPEHFPNADGCAMGLWLRFVDVPHDKASVLDDLRMWHSVWHNATESLFVSVNEGRLLDAQAAVNNRTAGSWNYAGRKIDALLADLWSAAP